MDISLSFVPLIIGSGAILAWISLRNESISGRIRALNSEHTYEAESSSERRKTIKHQVNLLYNRYNYNRIALCMAMLAICLFVLFMIAVMTNVPGKSIGEIEYLVISYWLLGAGGVLMAFCLIIMFTEILFSHRALKEDIEFIKREGRRTSPVIKP